MTNEVVQIHVITWDCQIPRYLSGLSKVPMMHFFLLIG